MLLSISNPWQVVLTIVIVILLAGIYYIVRKLIFQKKETIHKAILIVTVLLEFILTLGAFVGILLIWEYPIDFIMTDLLEKAFLYIEEQIALIIASIAVIFAASLIINLSKMALKKVGKKEGAMQKRRKTIAKVTTSIIKYAIGIIAILVVLAIWGVNVLPALAGLGIAGLVIGLGAQKFINDLISGAFIIFEHHFDVGDIIEVAGFKGEVIDIGLKTTKIRNWRGEVKILANGDVVNITNFSTKFSMAVVEFTINYEEDINKVISLLNTNLSSMKNDYPPILEAPIITGAVGFGDNGVLLRAVCKTENEQHYGIERILRQKIKQILDQEHIAIAITQIAIREK